MNQYIVIIEKKFIYDEFVVQTKVNSKKVFAKNDNACLVDMQKLCWENVAREADLILLRHFKEGNLKQIDVDKIRVDINIDFQKWHRYTFENQRIGKKQIKNIIRIRIRKK
jgi:hypothetical protein